MPAAPPPSPNFLPTSRAALVCAPLRLPHELFSSALTNQRARPPRLAPRGGCPRPAPSQARRRPAQTHPGSAPARPARPRAEVSLPPSLPPAASQLWLPLSPPARSALGWRLEQRLSSEGGRRRAPSQRGRDPEAPEGPRLQPRLAPRPPSAATARTSPWLASRARGRNAGPHLGAAARCPAPPHGPALRASTESLTRGIGVHPPKERARPGGARAPQTRIGSNCRKKAPWSSGR